MTWTPPKPEPCGEGCTCHTTRTPFDEVGGVGTTRRTLPGQQDRPHQTPMWVRGDNGDLVQVWVEETPSDRLPSYQTGRVPAAENPAPEREPGGVSDQSSRRPWAFWRALNERSST